MGSGADSVPVHWLSSPVKFVESLQSAYDTARLRYQPFCFVRFDINYQTSSALDSAAIAEEWLRRIISHSDLGGILTDNRMGMVVLDRSVERVRRDLESLWHEAEADPRKASEMPTLSFGVAGLEGSGDTLHRLLRRAETSLQYALRTGGWKIAAVSRGGTMMISDYQALMIDAANWRMNHPDERPTRAASSASNDSEPLLRRS